jgi:hypothetical protein
MKRLLSKAGYGRWTVFTPLFRHVNHHQPETVPEGARPAGGWGVRARDPRGADALLRQVGAEPVRGGGAALDPAAGRGDGPLLRLDRTAGPLHPGGRGGCRSSGSSFGRRSRPGGPPRSHVGVYVAGGQVVSHGSEGGPDVKSISRRSPTRSRRHPCSERWRTAPTGFPLDQGNLGSCTGNAAAGTVNTVPVRSTGARLLKEPDAMKLYSQATVRAIPAKKCCPRLSEPLDLHAGSNPAGGIRRGTLRALRLDGA